MKLSQLFQPFVTPGPAPAQVDGALARGVRGPRDADPTTCATPRKKAVPWSLVSKVEQSHVLFLLMFFWKKSRYFFQNN